MALKKSDISFTNSVAQLKNRVAVPKYYFDVLPREVHALSFYVSELDKVHQVQGVLDSLQRATEEGFSFAEWKQNVAERNIHITNKAQQMAVYRNNTNNVYANSTRFNSLSSRVTPYLVVEAVGDDRTRDDHMLMDGVCARADSKIWDYYLPPYDHNCRCRVRAVTAEEAKRIGITHSMAGLPKFPFSKSRSNYGNILSGALADIKSVEKALPKNSPLKKEFERKIENAWSIVDILVEKNLNKFMKGF